MALNVVLWSAGSLPASTGYFCFLKAGDAWHRPYESGILSQNSQPCG